MFFLISTLSKNQFLTFSAELSKLISSLHQLDAAQLKDSSGAEIISEIFQLSVKHMGVDGCPFIVGLFVSAIGEGVAIQELQERITPTEGKAVLQYLIHHPELYKASLQGTSPVG